MFLFDFIIVNTYLLFGCWENLWKSTLSLAGAALILFVIGILSIAYMVR
jgi:hypothetical protein